MTERFDLVSRPLPGWFDDAKLGIMVHWGPYSVPAWAPRSGAIWDQADQFRDNPYAEWYRNSLHIPGSPVHIHHADQYGADFGYESFGPMFNDAHRFWDPGEWSDLFARCKARYVVPVAKHHDGFLLWPSAHRNPHAPDGYAATRDLIGELAAAVRGRGMRFGVYYSGGLDWPWNDIPIRSFADFAAAIPRDRAYIDYAVAHWRELIDRYEPACMWNDIHLPGPRAEVAALMRDYYARVPDGVINDRFRSRATASGREVTVHHDFTTPEYQAIEGVPAKKFEAVRGIGHSFGYNREEGQDDYLRAEPLVHLFIDIVSRGGNLLLNVGPRADGSIPETQRARLEELGAWLETCGEGIFETRPWQRPAGATRSGLEVRFTTCGAVTYVHVLGTPAGREAAILNFAPADGSTVEMLGHSGHLMWRREGIDLAVRLPEPLPSPYAVTLRITAPRP
ncbi:MAG: alpha-L-fucosidase [Chloroflexi bacterium]|nr:alpha-L-fucosidase [Chloroflexota bacterium]